MSASAVLQEHAALPLHIIDKASGRAMKHALVDYLRDFSAPTPFQRKASRVAAGAAALECDERGGGEDIDVNALVDAAFERGFAEGRRQAETEHEARRSADARRHSEELEALTTRHEHELGSQLGEKLECLKSELASQIGEGVGAVLGPLLDEAVTKRTIEALGEKIRSTVADKDVTEIEVTGSPALFEALRSRVDEAVPLAFTPNEEFDLTVTFDGTVMSTQLAEWADALREAMA